MPKVKRKSIGQKRRRISHVCNYSELADHSEGEAQPALQFQTMEQKTTPDANRSEVEEQLPVPVPGVWEWGSASTLSE